MESETTGERARPDSSESENEQKALHLIKSLTRQLKDPIVGINGELKIIYVSKAAETLLGYTEPDLLGHSLDILNADFLNSFDTTIEQDILLKQIWGKSWVIKRKDGSIFNCKILILPLIDSKGHLSSGICILRDITQRKTEYKILLESEKRIRLALDGADLGLWDWYIREDCIFADERCVAIWGSCFDDMFCRPGVLFEKIHPDDRPGIRKLVDALLEGQVCNIEVEFRRVTDSGETIWIQQKGKVTQWHEDGTPMRVTGTCGDITKQKLTEESLHESEEVLRATFNAIDSGILVVDNKGNVSHMNRNFGELWRIPEDILITKNQHKMIGSVLDDVEEPEKFLARIHELYNSSEECLEEIRFRDGRIFERFSCPLIRAGKIRGRLLNFRDITEQRQSEEARRRLESRLNQFQKMEALGTLAGGIAHDFNNILSAIMGYAELAMAETEHSSQGAGYLNEVLKSTNRAKELIRHILTFSRQKEIHHAPVDIRPIIKETIKMLRSIIPTTIEIRQNIVGSGLILSDSTEIHQVLMNLCTNASQAMNNNGGVLEIGLRKVGINGDNESDMPDLPRGSYVVLTVSDTGHGIAPEIMDRIFEPYFTTKEPGVGTGMGLSVVHGIVESQGGSILCRSIPGQGTTFDIYFPEIDSGEEAAKTLEDRPVPTGTECILFIDDEPALVELGKTAIESWGYKVVSSISSIEALELFRHDPDIFDLVITDMTMPGMTGDRLAQQIIEIRHDIPVILCTGYSERVTEERTKEIGISEFLLKPLLMKDLARTIRKVLDENRNAPE